MTERRAARALAANPGGVIYGVLAVGTVVAAESTRRETFAKVLGASLLTLILYWLAHAYAHHLGDRLRRPAEWSGRELIHVLRHEAYLLAGAALPLLGLAGAWLAGASLEAGVTAALWCAGVELLVLEVVAGLLRRLPPRELAIETLIGVALGVGILGVRVLLH